MKRTEAMNKRFKEKVMSAVSVAAICVGVFVVIAGVSWLLDAADDHSEVVPVRIACHCGGDEHVGVVECAAAQCKVELPE